METTIMGYIGVIFWLYRRYIPSIGPCTLHSRRTGVFQKCKMGGRMNNTLTNFRQSNAAFFVQPCNPKP